MSSKRLKMSSSTNAPGQRRVSRGLDDAANKKKQKDRANQESKEGESPSPALQRAGLWFLISAGWEPHSHLLQDKQI